MNLVQVLQQLDRELGACQRGPEVHGVIAGADEIDET